MDTFKILVELTFYPKEVIGKDRKYSNKYCPAFKIRKDMYNSGQIEFVDRIEAHSGEANVEAYIIFPYKHLLERYIYVGKNFTFGEGLKKLGEGVVLKIERLNDNHF